MKKRIISMVLALIMVLGMIPLTMAEEAAVEETPALEPITVDFMGFAAEASQQDFWADLLTNNVEGARTLGLPYAGERIESYTAALTAMDAWMKSNGQNWTVGDLLDSSMGNYNHPYGARYLYLDPAQSNFGLRFYTPFPKTQTNSGENRLWLNITVPEGGAGKYVMTVEGFYEKVSGSAIPSYTGADQGGALSMVVINGEEIGTFHQSKGDNGPDEIVTDGLGVVELQEGVNDVRFYTYGDRNGGANAGRCALNLRNIKFEPIDDSDLVLDFMAIRDIAQEDFWSDLRATAQEGTKSIGCASATQPTAEYTAALGELETWLDNANLGWDIPDLLNGYIVSGHYNHPYGQRRMYVDSVNDYYGLRLYTPYPGNGGGECKFTFRFYVPAGQAGVRDMIVETYDEAVTSVVPSAEGFDFGGGMASFYINEEELIYYHEFGAEEDGIRTVTGEGIELQPGWNDMIIVLEADRNGVTNNAGGARCAINLRKITFVDVPCTHEFGTYEEYEKLRNGTHTTFTYCEECDVLLSEEVVDCADGDDADTKCDGCGFETSTRGPSTSEFAETSIVVDFMDFAYNVIQQDFFKNLRQAEKADGTWSIGVPYAGEITAEQQEATAQLQNWLDENANWTIEDLTESNMGHYAHSYGGRQIYIDTINEYYGIRFYTHIPAHPNGYEGSDISELKLLVNVPEGKAGTYNMNVEGFYEAVSSAVPMADPWDQGGAKVVTYVNDVAVGNFHQANGDPGRDEIVVDELGEVTLEEGFNSVVFFVEGDRNSGPYAGRCALNLRNIEFQLVELAPEPSCDHTNTTESVASNGDKTHTVTVTCECGEVISTETVACTDEDKDCLCDVCGATIKEITKISVVGANMTLGNDLKMNFMINKADMKEGYVAKVSQAGAEPVALELWSYNAAYYAASYSVAAKEMTDVLSVEIYDADGYLVSNPFTRTVKQYAMTLLNNASQKASLKSVIVDMLNYGTEAQKYFGHNEDAYANAEVTAEQQETYATKEVECVNNQQGGTNFVGANLSLEDSILLNVFFRGITNGDLTGVTATVSFTDYLGNEVTANAEIGTQGTSMVKVVVNQIVLADAKRPVTVTVYKDGAELGSGIESVESYIARNLNNESTGALNMAIMKFSASAYNHLGGTN